MKMRMPAYPLITNDPYLNIWSFGDKLNESNTVHWTGKPYVIRGVAVINNTEYVFLGEDSEFKKAEQHSVDVTALSTVYNFSCGSAGVTVKFTSPLLPDDIEVASRPLSYISVKTDSEEDTSIRIELSEDLCLDKRGQYDTEAKTVNCKFPTVMLGSTVREVLKKSGDDLRIDYGYLYLSACSGTVYSKNFGDCKFIGAELKINTKTSGLLTVAYDDIYSIEYFGEQLKSVWNNNGETLVSVVEKAINDYENIISKCDEFDSKLFEDASRLGGEKYAELLEGAYRQCMAAHKTVVDGNGELLFVSKECFSNGCAATVDVTYPSSPIFLYYNTNLLKGMLRPVFRYAESDAWKFNFAPHDVGTYPILNGQTYYDCKLEYQMPIEECGNMIILTSAMAIVDNDTEFVLKHKPILDMWADYLYKNGFDPENQLCTDDFSGHLAHNCNLSLKCICAVKLYSKVCKKISDETSAKKYSEAADVMVKLWLKNAVNSDKTTRLAFDIPNSYGLKYNMIWDKVFTLNMFENSIFENEFEIYADKALKYGTPLDNRANYTKSDWLLWCACFAKNKADFEKLVKLVWDFYNESSSRVPMTDWYDADSGTQHQFDCEGTMIGFQNRTVVGGFWIKMLIEKMK